MHQQNFQVREGKGHKLTSISNRQLHSRWLEMENGRLGLEAMADHGMRRVILLECGCAGKLIQEPTMKANPLVVMWSACGVVVTKTMIQISEGAIFYYRKRTGSLCNNSSSF